MKLRTLNDVDCSEKTVLIRLDLNVPMKDGEIQDDTRLQAALPSVKHLIDQGAKVVILTHFGRPKGQIVDKLRVDPIAKALSTLLNQEITKLDDCVGPEVQKRVQEMAPGEVILLENTRFHPEEKANDPEFSKQLASLGDIYLNDAFGAIHRAHASTVGITEHLPSYAGFLVEKEVEILSQVLENPKKPVCLIVGGAKIDTKIGILEKFLGKADSFLIGGALANTFIAAQGHAVGTSLFQEDKIPVAKKFLDSTDFALVPTDVILSDQISDEAHAVEMPATEVADNMKILDLGPKTVEEFINKINEAQTIIWNGPLGLYEFKQFAGATRAVAEAVAKSDATTILGGGDTIDAVKEFGYTSKDFTHISTGGGAMLEFLEGKELAGLGVLKIN